MAPGSASDAVVYGEVVHYEAYYLALLSGWQVSVRGGMVSTHNGEQLVSFYGSRYDMNFSPALDPEDILINSAESLLQLRDIELARSEQEVCRELVLRIPVSENLRLQIAREALETDLRAENSAMPVSMTTAQREASPPTSRPVSVETPPHDESAYVDSVPAQPVNGVEIRAAGP